MLKSPPPKSGRGSCDGQGPGARVGGGGLECQCIFADVFIFIFHVSTFSHFFCGESGDFLLVSVFPGIHCASESVFEGFVLDKIIILSAPAALGEIPNA